MKKDYSNQFEKTIIIKEKGKFEQINISEIYKITCESYISTIVTKDEYLNVSKILKKIEEELKEFGFFRANRNTLVNIRHIKKYKNNEKALITLSNKDEIIISKRNVSKLLKIIKK